MAGGVVGPTTKLVAQLFDQSGINTSSLNPATNIIATLDNKLSFIVNDYYISNKDNFKKGMLTYPLDTLQKGRHTLTFKASDTYNNTSSTSIDFVVSEGSQIQIEDFVNYPNPMQDKTSFQFSHSRPGEALEVKIVIYNTSGQLAHSQDYLIEDSQYQVTLPEWNGEGPDGRILSNGLYLARLFVRSQLDGSNNEQSTKLLLVK